MTLYELYKLFLREPEVVFFLFFSFVGFLLTMFIVYDYIRSAYYDRKLSKEEIEKKKKEEDNEESQAKSNYNLKNFQLFLLANICFLYIFIFKALIWQKDIIEIVDLLYKKIESEQRKREKEKKKKGFFEWIIDFFFYKSNYLFVFSNKFLFIFSILTLNFFDHFNLLLFFDFYFINIDMTFFLPIYIL